MEAINKLKRGDGISALKKEFENNRVIIGTNEVMKMLKSDKIKKIYLTKTISAEIINSLGSSKVEKEYLEIDALELGKSLGKNFPISMAGVKK